MSVAAACANGVVSAFGMRAHQLFRRALRDPATAQRRILARLVTRNASTAFGTEHGFGAIQSVGDYRDRVPLRSFDELRPWLGAVEAGRRNVLTADDVRWLEPSGGSLGPSKLVPYTDGLRREIAAATLPWLFDVYASRPRLRTGSAYWAISPPVGRAGAATSGGVRIGAAGDADFFPRPISQVLAAGQAVPPSVAAAGDIAACRRATLAALIGASDLSLISVWSPSFLTLLATALDEHWDELRRVRHLPARPPDDLQMIWPRLDLISCWADASARRALGAMRSRFPAVDIQPKGLLATEGVVSIPLHDAPAPVAAIRSHFLEFIAGGTTHLAHELDVGATYEVALTTGGGLYRYRLGDLVRVEGRVHATPLLRFVGRADGRVDLAGEKLSPTFVEHSLRRAEAASGVATRFAVLAPNAEARGYVVSVEPFLDSDAPDATACESTARLATALEAELQQSYSYRVARDLGQLDAVAGYRIRDGERLWETTRVAAGQRAGAIKPPALAAHSFPPPAARDRAAPVSDDKDRSWQHL